MPAHVESGGTGRVGRSPARRSSASGRDGGGGGGETIRRGRSRSPMRYVKKTGRSIKGLLTGKKKKKKKLKTKKDQMRAEYLEANAEIPQEDTECLAGAGDGGSTVVPGSHTSSGSTSARGRVGVEQGQLPTIASASSGLYESAVEEEDTVYDVVVDDSSVSSRSRRKGSGPAGGSEGTGVGAPDGASSTISTSSSTMQIVLLLMELTDRRFELLQLEFDLSGALVKDVLSQIPVAATEESLRKHQYSGICTVRGKEMGPNEKLRDLMGGDSSNGTTDTAVAVAMPNGVSGKDCARLAAPILNDPKVRSMLHPVVPLLDTMSKPRRRESTGEIGGAGGRTAGGRKEELRPADALPSTSTARSSYTITTKEKRGFFLTMVGLLLRIILASIPVFVGLHLTMTAPLRPGDVMSDGQWRSKCGLLTLLPEEYTGCHDLSVEWHGSFGGAMILYDVGDAWRSGTHEDKQIPAWRLSASSSSFSSMTEGAGAVLRVLGDGSLFLGNEMTMGTTVGRQSPTSLVLEIAGGDNDDLSTYLYDKVLSPWPFEIEPNIYRKRRAKRGADWLTTSSSWPWSWPWSWRLSWLWDKLSQLWTK